MKWLAATIAAVMVLCLVQSCSKPAPLSESADFKSLPADGWAYGDTLYYTPGFADSVGKARLAIVVRHTDAYLYSNLWLELSTPVEGVADSMALDTVNIRLADVYGKWFGRGVGVSYVSTDTLAALYDYDKGRPVKLRHIMRVDTLADIEQVGIIFLPQPDATTH